MKTNPTHRGSTRFPLFVGAVASALLFGACSKSADQKPSAYDGEAASSAAQRAMDNTKDTASRAATTVKNTTVKAWADLKDATYDQRASFRDGVNKLAENVDAGMATLDRKGGALSASAKDGWADGMKKLKEARSDLAAKLDKLGDATANNWEKAKADVAAAWERVEQSYKNLEQKMQS